MAILIKSKTPEADRNFWATQWGCFLDAQRLHGRSFRLDVAAEPGAGSIAADSGDTCVWRTADDGANEAWHRCQL